MTRTRPHTNEALVKMRAGLAFALLIAWLALVAPCDALAPANGAAVDLGASETLSEKASGEPWFCHNLDCPPFAVEAKGDSYDVRVYPAGLRWTSTVVTGSSFDDAVSTGFMRLFRYISGENETGEKIKMTAPVRVEVAPGDGPFCDSNFTVSFFVPFEDGSGDDTANDRWKRKQRDVPFPTDASVFESEDEVDLRVFVSTFGGYSDAKKTRREAVRLAERVKRDGVAVTAERYFYAGYDSPFRAIDRHNEVWMTGDENAD